MNCLELKFIFIDDKEEIYYTDFDEQVTKVSDLGNIISKFYANFPNEFWGFTGRNKAYVSIKLKDVLLYEIREVEKQKG